MQSLEQHVEKWIESLLDLLPQRVAERKARRRELAQVILAHSFASINLAPSSTSNDKSQSSSAPKKKSISSSSSRGDSKREAPTRRKSSKSRLPSRRFAVQVLDTASVPRESLVYHARCDPEWQAAAISGARWLTSTEAVKQTLEVTLALPDTYPQFVPGDAIGMATNTTLDCIGACAAIDTAACNGVAIRCPNPSSVVTALLERLELNGDAIFQLTALEGVTERMRVLFPVSATVLLGY
jgi:hypothetical protein